MKQRIAAFIFAVLASITGLVSDYTETTAIEEERMAEAAEYTEIGALRNVRFGGYTIDEMISSFEDVGTAPEKSLFSGKRLIEVPLINQYPLLPCGCEIASTVSLLNLLGYNTTLQSFTDGFINHTTNVGNDYGFTRIKAQNSNEEDTLIGPDPKEVFIGNPYGWGYGCKAPVISTAINEYFTTAQSDFKALDVYDLKAPDFKRLINGGIPVIVWATLDMESFDYRDPSVWTVEETGETITWYKGSHTLLMCGYDADAYYFMDPNDKETIIPYPQKLFLTRFEEAGSQAVLVIKEEKEKAAE
ncbi:MAG: C39 family peptidase [Ruminococcus sp.]|jgi:uncharacterized protein YvpB|nr:C39 family peptidase [Ruminococcus sp.]